MTKHVFILILVVVMVNLLAITGFAGDEKAKGKTKFMVVVSHTPEQCLAQLDKINAKGADLLNKFEWGCKAGDHTGYALMESEDEAAVKNMLPMDVQSSSKIVKVNKFSPSELETIHKGMKN
jgi:hypothetical protein